MHQYPGNREPGRFPFTMLLRQLEDNIDPGLRFRLGSHLSGVTQTFKRGVKRVNIASPAIKVRVEVLAVTCTSDEGHRSITQPRADKFIVLDEIPTVQRFVTKRKRTLCENSVTLQWHIFRELYRRQINWE